MKPLSVISAFSRITEKDRSPSSLWMVSCEWLGGHDRRRFLLEKLFRDEEGALAAYHELTPERHEALHGLGFDAGFVRHPIRRYDIVKDSAA